MEVVAYLKRLFALTNVLYVYKHISGGGLSFGYAFVLVEAVVIGSLLAPGRWTYGQDRLGKDGAQKASATLPPRPNPNAARGLAVTGADRS